MENMIPPHIIEELVKRRRQEQQQQPKYLELELPLPPYVPQQKRTASPTDDGDEDLNRGVQVIELF